MDRRVFNFIVDFAKSSDLCASFPRKTLSCPKNIECLLQMIFRHWKFRLKIIIEPLNAIISSKIFDLTVSHFTYLPLDCNINKTPTVWTKNLRTLDNAWHTTFVVVCVSWKVKVIHTVVVYEVVATFGSVMSCNHHQMSRNFLWLPYLEQNHTPCVAHCLFQFFVFFSSRYKMKYIRCLISFCYNVVFRWLRKLSLQSRRLL